jgi:hypothetical protein
VTVPTPETSTPVVGERVPTRVASTIVVVRRLKAVLPIKLPAESVVKFDAVRTTVPPEVSTVRLVRVKVRAVNTGASGGKEFNPVKFVMSNWPEFVEVGVSREIKPTG